MQHAAGTNNHQDGSATLGTMQLYDSNEYRASDKWPYAIAAGCVVYRTAAKEVEILLLKRGAGDFPQLRDGDIDTYHLPKGHVAIGETLEQAAVRETAEEAGCEVEIQTYLGAHVNNYKDHQGLNQDKIVHYFAGQWRSDLGSMDAEHSDTVWVGAQKAIEMIGNSNPKREDELVARLLAFLELSHAA